MGSEFLQIPNGWNVKPLVECTADQIISYGIVQPGSHVGDGVPILRVNNFSNNSLDASTVLKVAPEIEKKFSRTRLKGGEVLLTLVGSTGQSIVAPASLSGWNVARAVAVIRPAQDVGANWINICLQSSATKNFLDSRANTTVQKTLNLQDVKQIPILIPPKDVKEFIESTITSLNCKIELNNQINTTLESMAQALFKSWFVDFDPVIDNAIACGNPIPDELSDRAERRRALNQNPNSHFRPLPTEIQQLFPSSFVLAEEMGWMPEGWEIAELRSKAKSIQYGLTQSASETVVGPKFLRITDIRGGNINWRSVPYCNVSTEELGKYRIRQGDIFVARTGASTGENTYIHHAPPAVFASYLVRFTFDELTIARLVGMQMRSPSYFSFVQGVIGGSAQPNASAQALASFVGLFPSIKVSEAFYKLVSPIDDNRAQRAAQNENFEVLRDLLLPKLLSGQIQFPEAEALLNDTL